MGTNADNLRDSVRVASDNGTFVAKGAGAVDPSNPVLGRVATAASAVTLGAQLLPAAGRLFKRYPVISILGIAMLAGAATYWLRSMRTPGRSDPELDSRAGAGGPVR